VRAADLDTSRRKEAGVPEDRFTTDASRIVDANDIDVVVELIGGTSIARDLTLQALASGKSIVTANKALLASHGPELYAKALETGAGLSFEASVAGGIPVILALRDGLAANKVEQILGIVNGTANYILTRMSRDGMTYGDALAQAQNNGYAESDPSFDVNGTDSAHKLAILAAIAFGKQVKLDDIYVEGIEKLTPADIGFAAGMGYTVKLLAVGKPARDALELRVHPAMIPNTHPLASVSGVFNAVCATGSAVGDTMFYGQGAGRWPTASAVVADLIDLGLGRTQPAFRRLAERLSRAPTAKVLNIGDLEGRYYLRLQALDLPGVLAAVAKILGDHRISLASVLQQERKEGEVVPLVMMTHGAVESNLRNAVDEIDAMDVIKGKTLVVRVEDQ
jgi:homoserine dehydrogenase